MLAYKGAVIYTGTDTHIGTRGDGDEAEAEIEAGTHRHIDT